MLTPVAPPTEGTPFLVHSTLRTAPDPYRPKPHGHRPRPGSKPTISYTEPQSPTF